MSFDAGPTIAQLANVSGVELAKALLTLGVRADVVVIVRPEGFENVMIAALSPDAGDNGRAVLEAAYQTVLSRAPRFHGTVEIQVDE